MKELKELKLREVKPGQKLKIVNKYPTGKKDHREKIVTLEKIKTSEDPEFVWLSYYWQTTSGEKRMTTELLKGDINVLAPNSLTQLANG